MVVKEGYARYMGRCLPAGRRNAKIEEGAETALKNKDETKLTAQLSRRFPIEFNRLKKPIGGALARVNRIDAYTLEYESGSFLESHQWPGRFSGWVASARSRILSLGLPRSSSRFQLPRSGSEWLWSARSSSRFLLSRRDNFVRI